MIRTVITVTCDGGCGTEATMSGETLNPKRALEDVGWQVVRGPVDKHYCPTCRRARLVGTV